MNKPMTECKQLEDMIKNPANRVVPVYLSETVMGYELQDALGKTLLRGFDRPVNAKSSLVSGGIYSPEYTRKQLRYWEGVFLFNMMKQKYQFQQTRGAMMSMSAAVNIHKR